ncbi:hypothetical protein FOZ63_000588 [Perkinsus olseni]|uniref:Peptidase C1A papain C-terminal domain-containing protein n=1 Tax=Perkinsus olseni TaxID=32597 RepID=A0A7J6UMB8_PEROL|nr:hypothetical protein FOZ63_000588 [Perkinsus olseni]
MFVKPLHFSAGLIAFVAADGCRKSMFSDHSNHEVVISPLPHTYTEEHHLPASFDWRHHNGVNYVTKVLNQHAPKYCGSCWLHAGVGVINDRLKVARNAQFPEVNVARQVVLNCGRDIAGSCHGGEDFGVYKFAYLEGLPDDQCQFYRGEDGECSAINNCINCDPPAGTGPCYPVQRYGRYFVTEFAKIPNPTAHKIKAEVYRRGPISCAVDSSVVENGKYHPGDIVRETRNGNWSLDHDIVIVGWGQDKDGKEYYIVKNSWGTFWGDQGYFLVQSGVNAMGIEQDCSWAVVDPEPRVADYGPPDWMRMFPSAFKPVEHIAVADATEHIAVADAVVVS